MIEVIAADCLTIDPSICRACQAMFADPPFSRRTHRAQSVGMVGVGKGNVARDFGFGHLTPELRRYLIDCARQIDGWSVIHCDDEPSGRRKWERLLAAAEAPVLRPLPWIRWSQPMLTGDRPPRMLEWLLAAHPTTHRPAWNGPGGMGYLIDRCMRGSQKHPTQKPLEQALRVVSSFSNPGDLVYLPCEGSGTYALACLILGRDALAMERHPRWARHIRERLDAPSEDDARRVASWEAEWRADAEAIPTPKAAHQRKTWERAQRRLADCRRAWNWLR